MPILFDACLILLAYLIGAVPTGLLLGLWIAGVDLRKEGSMNIGTTNAWRVLGAKLGLLTFALDVGKGAGAVLLAAYLAAGGLPIMPVLAGIAVLFGNFFNVFLGGKGGKGVATSLGVFLALAPKAIIVTFAIFLIVLGLSRYVSLSSLTAAVALPFLVYYYNGITPVFWMVLLVAILVIVKHRSNISRLLKGTENKIGKKKPQSATAD